MVSCAQKRAQQRCANTKVDAYVGSYVLFLMSIKETQAPFTSTGMPKVSSRL